MREERVRMDDLATEANPGKRAPVAMKWGVGAATAAVLVVRLGGPPTLVARGLDDASDVIAQLHDGADCCEAVSARADVIESGGIQCKAKNPDPQARGGTTAPEGEKRV
jgi:hypothetical protein